MINRILILFLILFPGLSFADVASGPFTPPSSDISMQILNSLFGQIGAFGDSSSDAFSNVMLTFNQAVLMVGGILATYTILAGTIGTAHDGEMLGKKFSSVWIPIRYSIGTALILPVINGYSVINYLVSWCLVQGVGLADMTWEAYMSDSNIQSQLSVGLNKPEAKTMGWNAFASIVCLKGYEGVLELQKSKDSAAAVLFTGDINLGISKATINGGTDVVYRFGSPDSSNNLKPDSCGSLTVPVTTSVAQPQPSQNTANRTNLSINPYAGLEASNKEYMQEMAQINAKNNTALDTLLSDLNETAIKLLSVQNENEDLNPLINNVNASIAKYENTLRDNAATLVTANNNLKELQESAHVDGWAMAGAYYMKISHLIDLASQSMGAIPVATGVQLEKQVFSDQLNDSAIKLLLKMKKDNPSVSFAVNNIEGHANDEFSTWKWVKKGFDMTYAMKHLSSGLTSWAIDDGANPVLEMQRLGKWCLLTGGAIQTAYVALITGGSAASDGVLGFAVAMLPIMGLFTVGLFTAGFTLAYILPMMPFIMWMGVILGWMIMAVEAIIISSLWMAMHLHPNGDDLVGRGANGYSLLLSLILRPVFAVFGLIASINIINILGTVINKVWGSAFLLSQSDSGVFFLLCGLVASPLIYCGFMFVMVKKCFSVTSTIADELLKWFGGSGSQLGQVAQELNGNGTYAAMGAVGTAVASGNRAFKDGQDLRNNNEKSNLEKLDNFNKANNAAKENFGNDVRDKKFEALGIKDYQDMGSISKVSASSAYDEGANMAKQFAGAEGVEQFANKMLEESRNGFSNYGGTALSAANEISRKIAANGILDTAKNQFGDDGYNQVLNASKSEDGTISFNKAQKAYNTLSASMKITDTENSTSGGGSSALNPSDYEIPTVQFDSNGNVSVDNNEQAQQRDLFNQIDPVQTDLFNQEQSTQNNQIDTQQKNSDERDW